MTIQVMSEKEKPALRMPAGQGKSMKRAIRKCRPGKIEIVSDRHSAKAGAVYSYGAWWYLVPNALALEIDRAISMTTHGHCAVWRKGLDFGAFAACISAGLPAYNYGPLFVLDARVSRVGCFAERRLVEVAA